MLVAGPICVTTNASGLLGVVLAQGETRVVVLDGDLGNSTKAERVRQTFPERFFNIGIAESNLVGIGAGLAAAGFIPWITSFSSSTVEYKLTPL